MAKKHEGNRIIKAPVRPWYRWHRRIGIVSAVFIIILSVTGLLLNHNVVLGLHQKFITSAWLLDWYGYDAKAGYAAEVLTADKIILDIHTGRFFGAYGPYVMDAAAITFLILTGTGIYMWSRRLPRKTRRHRKK